MAGDEVDKERDSGLVHRRSEHRNKTRQVNA